MKSKHSAFFKKIYRDQEPDFWNSFTKQTQQFPCPSNTSLRGPEPKTGKKEQLNRHNKLSCTNHKRTITNSSKTAKNRKKHDTHPLFPHPNPNINEPPAQPSHQPLLETLIQWPWYPWYKWGNVMDLEV